MRKLVILILAAVIVVALLVGGCAKPAPTPAPAPAPTPAPAKPIELKIATHTPPMHYVNVFFEQWIKEVEERTDGRVKIILYPAQTLGNVMDEWIMLTTSVSNIGWILPTHYQGTFPLTDSLDLPLFIPRGRPLSVLNGLFDKFLYKEFEEVKVLWPGWLGYVDIHMVTKPVRTLEDFKGMQIACPPGATIAGTVKALGAVPAPLPAPEFYTSLERGMVDGSCIPLEAMIPFRVYEVTKYSTFANIGFGMNVTAMNLETWNSLPPDIQKVFEELSLWAQESMNNAASAADEEAISICKEAGQKFIYLSPEEKARWAETTKPLVDDWSAKMDAKGLPGTAVIDEAHRLMAEVLEK